MEDSKYLGGSNLAGGQSIRGRVEDDFYATDQKSTRALLNTYKFSGSSFLEPCVGQGHIAEVIKEYFPSATIIGWDLVDRGYITDFESIDFLTFDSAKYLESHPPFDNIITNPPYAFAQEFVEKSLELVKSNGVIAMFLKIQFLEGKKRQAFFKLFPPKYVYVFVNRQSPQRNGEALDEKGKPWSSTMCFAWFIWEKGFQGEPTVRWL